MKIYRVQNDVEHFQYFLTEKEEDTRALLMDCTRRAHVWHPPQVYIYEPLLQEGDFFQFAGGCLILSPRATELLRTHLEMAGELLPLPYNGTTYTLLNVLECINCLDAERTGWAEWEGRRLHPERYVFHSNRFSESELFKIPETYRAEILVVERDPDEGFVADLKRFDVQGYELTLLWDSEADQH